MIFMPLADIADRYTILKLKIDRLPNNNDIIELFGFFSAALEDELNILSPEVRKQIESKIKELYLQNAATWDLEALIRNGSMDNPDSLLEVGRRTLLIRDSNKKRVQIKNEISILSQQKYGLEIKVDHRSA